MCIMSQVDADVERADIAAYRACGVWAPFRKWEADKELRCREAVGRAIEGFLLSRNAR